MSHQTPKVSFDEGSNLRRGNERTSVSDIYGCKYSIGSPSKTVCTFMPGTAQELKRQNDTMAIAAGHTVLPEYSLVNYRKILGCVEPCEMPCQQGLRDLR